MITWTPAWARTVASAVLLAGAMPFAALGQSQAQKDVQDAHMGYLAREGYRPELTPLGNVVFKHQGRSYIIHIDENDPQLFRLTVGFTVEGKTPENRQRRLEALNLVTSEIKVVKAYLDSEGDIAFSTQILVPTPADSARHLSRVLNILDVAYDRYLRKMRDDR